MLNMTMVPLNPAGQPESRSSPASAAVLGRSTDPKPVPARSCKSVSLHGGSSKILQKLRIIIPIYLLISIYLLVFQPHPSQARVTFALGTSGTDYGPRNRSCRLLTTSYSSLPRPPCTTIGSTLPSSPFFFRPFLGALGPRISAKVVCSRMRAAALRTSRKI